MPRTDLQNRILAMVEAERSERNGNKTSKPGNDARYLDWIRTLPCLVCSMNVYEGCWLFSSESDAIFETAPEPGTRFSEAAHVGIRGLGTKCDDRETIPLCARHHRTGRDAHHVLGKWFWLYHSLDRERVIGELQRRYSAGRG